MSKKKKTLEQLLDEVEYVEDINRNVVFTKLGNLIRTQKGKKPKELIELKKSENFVPYVNIDLMSGAKKNEIQYADKSGNVVLCNEQDVLMVWDGARSGFVGRGVSGIIGSTLSKIEIPLISNDYLYHFLKFQFQYLNKNTKGTGIPHVDPLVLNEIEIPLYSLSEQKRISDKIEILFVKVDEAKKLIKDAEESLGVRKQTILRDAFQGKFTKTQREEIELIKLESKDKFLNDENPNFGIPEEWQWVRLGELIDSISDYHANGSYKVLKEHVELLDTPDYALMIRATNFEKNNFETLNKYITKSAYEFLSKSKLFGGEILMSKIGNTGSVYLMPNLNKPCSLAMNLFSLKVNQDFNNEYIYYYLNSPMGKVNIEKYIKGVTTTSIDKISVKSIYIPLPSRREQDVIVNKIKKMLDLEECIYTKITSELKGKLDFIKQSILSKAFMGELGTNDPTDEPAIELLKSILQEKL